MYFLNVVMKALDVVQLSAARDFQIRPEPSKFATTQWQPSTYCGFVRFYPFHSQVQKVYSPNLSERNVQVR